MASEASDWRPLPREKRVTIARDTMLEMAKLTRVSTYTVMTTRGFEEDIKSAKVEHMPEFDGWGLSDEDGDLIKVYPDEESAERAALQYLGVVNIEC